MEQTGAELADPYDPHFRQTLDQFDHGTALATLMVTVPDNGIGFAGVGRNIKIMNLRVGGDPEIESEQPVDLTIALPAALGYAVRNGARVIVCSILSIHNIEWSGILAARDGESRDSGRLGRGQPRQQYRQR